jgi:hypothetical protein
MAYENHDIIWSEEEVWFGLDRIWTLQMLLHIQFYLSHSVCTCILHIIMHSNKQQSQESYWVT